MKVVPRKSLSVALILLFLLPLAALAQGQFGRQGGTVTDPDGKPLKGVEVTAGRDKVVTDAEGKFIFLRMSPRTYTFSFKLEGYQTHEVRKQVNAIFNNRPINITMNPLPKIEEKEEKKEIDMARANEAVNLVRQQKFEEALPIFEEVISINPKLIWAQMNAAVCYLSLGRDKEAHKCLDAVLELEPENVSALTLKANAYLQDSDATNALTYFEKLVALNAADAQTLLTMGEVYNYLQRRNEAVETLKKAIAMDPTMSEAYLQLGMSQANIGNYGESIEPLEKYLEMEPESSKRDSVIKVLVDALLKHGTQLLVDKNTEEAIPILRRVIELAPDSEDAKDAQSLLDEVKNK